MIRSILLPGLLAISMPALALDDGTPAEPPIDYLNAKIRADTDEAALPPTQAQAYRARQGALLENAVHDCAMPRPDTSPFTIVVRIDADGSIGASWRHGSTPLAICVEKMLRLQPLPRPEHAPLYLSYELSFTP